MRELCLDFETTGLSADDRIVEIGAVELENYLPTGKVFHRYVNPQRFVGESARVHRLTDAFLRDQPLFHEIARDLMVFLQADSLIAHNASFDRRMLNAELERLGLLALPNPWIDTMELAKANKDHRKKGRSGLSLDALCSRFKIDASARKERGHGALLDAQILAKVYLGLRGGLQMDLEMAQEAAVRPPEPVRSIGPRAFVSRLTEAERASHAVFVATIKDPIWSHYGVRL
jgi:DNA polymerase-3 subunit epsilon